MATVFAPAAVMDMMSKGRCSLTPTSYFCTACTPTSVQRGLFWGLRQGLRAVRVPRACSSEEASLSLLRRTYALIFHTSCHTSCFARVLPLITSASLYTPTCPASIGRRAARVLVLVL
jgi:hypothetical protein